jgi:hypothetical protein
LIIAECADEESCDGSESVLLRNTIFLGNPEFAGGGDTTCLAWTDLSGALFTIDHALIDGLKAVPEPCPPDSLCDVSAGLVDPTIGAFDAHLAEGSPAIDAGTTQGAPADDFDGRPRDAQPDIGAYEQWAATSQVYLPLAARDASLLESETPSIVAGCSLFRPDNVWNTPVGNLPVDENSDAYGAAIGVDEYVHADFGSSE